MLKTISLNLYFSSEVEKPFIAVTPNLKFNLTYDDDDSEQMRVFFEKCYYCEQVVSNMQLLGIKAFYEVVERYRPEIR